MEATPTQKVIIIGATSGIGRELAIVYLKNGYRVGITGRRQNLLEELNNQYPQQVETACFDVTGNENIPQLEQLIKKMGGMDIFIYNSGYGDAGEQLDLKIEAETVKINVTGFTELTAYAFNWLCKQGSGQMAATSSIAAIRGSSWAPAYSASKAFMSNYMESLHLKNRQLKKQIAITDIQPGFVRTKMAKGNGQFWVAPPEKAALQMFNAIRLKKRKAFITRRWRLIAFLMKNMPYFIYKKLG
jgi:short-subunit dehydrogenase